MLLRSLPALSPLTRDVADRSENCWRLLVRRLHAKLLGIEAEDADVVLQGGPVAVVSPFWGIDQCGLGEVARRLPLLGVHLAGLDLVGFADGGAVAPVAPHGALLGPAAGVADVAPPVTGERVPAHQPRATAVRVGTALVLVADPVGHRSHPCGPSWPLRMPRSSRVGDT